MAISARDMSREIVSGVIPGTPEEDEDEDSYIWKFLQELFQGVPFVGQVYSSFKYGTPQIPAARVVSDVFQGGKALDSELSDKTRMKGLIKGVSGAAKLAGVPGTQQATEFALGLAKR